MIARVALALFAAFAGVLGSIAIDAFFLPLGLLLAGAIIAAGGES